jgi:flagellar motility protein MotE (MotC chaperone)
MSKIYEYLHLFGEPYDGLVKRAYDEYKQLLAELETHKQVGAKQGEEIDRLREQNESHKATNDLLNIREEQVGELLADLAALKSRLAEAEEALELIADLAFDRDGYTGNADKLGELIDELYGYAKDPKKAVAVLHREAKT